MHAIDFEVRWSTKWPLLIPFLLGACAVTSPTPQPRPQPRETPDQAVVRVLAEYGLSARIVRPWSAVKDAPAPGAKGVEIVLAGSPGVQMTLDRDYWAIAVAKPGKQADSWVLNPKDEQSGLNIAIGDDVHHRTDAQLAKEPGFTEITRHPGTVGGQAVTWRRWADENHYYSDCIVRISATGDPTRRGHQVELIVTANTQERRQALEEHLASLRLSSDMMSANRRMAVQQGVAPDDRPRTAARR